MDFKIKFPTGYQVSEILNDNIDVHILLRSEEVLFGTLFTLNNIQTLMSREHGSKYFWATDMVIVRDLEKETIENAIQEIINDGYINQAFTKIGYIQTVYSPDKSFEDF